MGREQKGALYDVMGAMSSDSGATAGLFPFAAMPIHTFPCAYHTLLPLWWSSPLLDIKGCPQPADVERSSSLSKINICCVVAGDDKSRSIEQNSRGERNPPRSGNRNPGDPRGLVRFGEGKTPPRPSLAIGGPPPSSSRGKYAEPPFWGSRQAGLDGAKGGCSGLEEVDKAGVRDKISPSVSTPRLQNLQVKSTGDPKGDVFKAPRLFLWSDFGIFKRPVIDGLRGFLAEGTVETSEDLLKETIGLPWGALMSKNHLRGDWNFPLQPFLGGESSQTIPPSWSSPSPVWVAKALSASSFRSEKPRCR
ncbi:hypothetical protein GWK47_052054 [Chionoecetes opilio]|uniref:Uncharacterized protein n=1 Tax=Chionoecetes opilio TaxID=41210 RepID=A0A8J4Y1L9_CHIOP|nr:hypothetical protein GWK47_052054 [Chionoecetes opilio]